MVGGGPLAILIVVNIITIIIAFSIPITIVIIITLSTSYGGASCNPQPDYQQYNCQAIALHHLTLILILFVKLNQIIYKSLFCNFCLTFQIFHMYRFNPPHRPKLLESDIKTV